MTEYVILILFLVVIFVAFALVHRNRRCFGCSGDCDETSCEKKT